MAVKVSVFSLFSAFCLDEIKIPLDENTFQAHFDYCNVNQWCLMTKLDALRATLHRLENKGHAVQEVLPFGVPEIDSKLLGNGLAFSAIHEFIGGHNDEVQGATAALFVAGILARTEGQILWCVTHRDLFAPALSQVGLDLQRVSFVETGDEKKLLACMEDGLRHGAVTAVVGELSRLPMNASRRLQLAAEQSGAMGVVLRRWWKQTDSMHAAEPTAARTRWRVSPLPSSPLPVAGIGRAQWRLELMRCRGGEYQAFDVEACDEEGYLTIPAELAYRPIPQAASHATG